MKIEISAKCNDLCFIEVPDLNLKSSYYVPSNLGIGGGDYIKMTIDSITGKIDGWLPLSEDDLREALQHPLNPINSKR